MQPEEPGHNGKLNHGEKTSTLAVVATDSSEFGKLDQVCTFMFLIPCDWEPFREKKEFIHRECKGWLGSLGVLKAFPNTHDIVVYLSFHSLRWTISMVIWGRMWPLYLLA